MFLSLLYVVHVLFLTISYANKQSETNHHKDASNQFANLLKDIVAINERRFEAMKELARLQEYSVTKYHLRSGREYFDEQKDIRGPLVVIIFEGHGQNFRTSMNKIKDGGTKSRFLRHTTRKSYSSGDSDDDSAEGLSILRKSWHSGCGKKMAKVCKRACRKAYKDVCMTYSCTRRIRRNFKKECKRNCKNSYNTGKYSDSDSDGYIVYEYGWRG